MLKLIMQVCDGTSAAATPVELLEVVGQADYALDDDTLHYCVPSGKKVYFSSHGHGNFSRFPASPAPIAFAPGKTCTLSFEVCGSHGYASLWLLQYGRGRRLATAHIPLHKGEVSADIEVDPQTEVVSWAIRLRGNGRLRIPKITVGERRHQSLVLPVEVPAPPLADMPALPPVDVPAPPLADVPASPETKSAFGGLMKSVKEVLVPRKEEVLGSMRRASPGAVALGPTTVAMIVLNDIQNDNRVLKCARSVVHAGHSVTLFGMSKTKGMDTVEVGEIAGCQTVLLPNPNQFLRPARTMVQGFRWVNTVSYMRICMWHYVRMVQPRILHTHDMNALAIGWSFKRQFRREGHDICWVHDFHEYVRGFAEVDPELLETALADEERCINDIDVALTVSPMLAANLKADYGLPQAPAVLLNAPFGKRFDPHYEPTIRQSLGFGADVPVVVYTGGVSPLRGVHTLVEAVGRVPDAHLVLVTENKGPYVDRLIALAEDGGFRNRLHFHPYVDPLMVPSFIRDASVAVHPMVRYGNAEVALPNKLFDYCHARIPQIVSDCESMKQFMDEHRVGEVFRAEDASDLAEKIVLVLRNRQDYVDRINASGSLLELMSWEAQERVLLGIYGDILRQDSLLSAAKQ